MIPGFLVPNYCLLLLLVVGLVGVVLLLCHYSSAQSTGTMTETKYYSIEVMAMDGIVYRGAHLGRNPDDVCYALSEWMPGCKILKVKEADG